MELNDSCFPDYPVHVSEFSDQDGGVMLQGAMSRFMLCSAMAR
jgi:hypothetical protein